jgi:hypothetical protein
VLAIGAYWHKHYEALTPTMPLPLLHAGLFLFEAIFVFSFSVVVFLPFSIFAWSILAWMIQKFGFVPHPKRLG